MKPIFVFSLILMCAISYCLPSFANGRAKWLVDSQKNEQASGGCIIKEVKNPTALTKTWFDCDNEGEIPRPGVSKSLGAAVQYNYVGLSTAYYRFKLPPGLISIYSFRFIRLLLFPHHAFD